MTGITSAIDSKAIQIAYPMGQNYMKQGQMVQGEVIAKSMNGTTIQVFGQQLSLGSSVNVLETSGQMALFEVIQSNAEQLTLKYVRPDEKVGSFSDEIGGQQPAKVIKDYQQMIQQSIKLMDPREMAEVQNLVKEAQASIEAIADTMTDSDMGQLLKEGMNPEKTSLEIVARVLANNKSLVRDQETKGIGEAVKTEVQQLKDHYSDGQQLKEIASALQDGNLPVSKRNVDKLVVGLKALDELKSLTSKEAMEILASHKDGMAPTGATSSEGPSLETLYKNIHTAVPGMKALSMSETELNAMVVGHMEKLGIEPTDQAIDVASEMVQRGIAVSEEKIQFVQNPSSVMNEINSSDVLEKMVGQLASSEKVTQVQLSELTFINESYSQSSQVAEAPQISEARVERLSQAIDLMGQMTDAHMVKAVMTDRHHTMEQAVSVIETSTDQGGQSLDMDLESDLTEEVVKFKKQLSVIQLRMTLDVAVRLEKQGIKVDTAPIEKVVESLEARESAIQQSQWQSYSGESHESEKYTTYSSAMNHLEQVESGDLSVAAQLMKDEGNITLRTVVDAGSSLEDTGVLDELKTQTAIGKYDASMTEVRPDLGDRVEATFDQIGPILEGLNMPVTKANVSAVEALAKNAMPITESTILDVQIIQEKIALLSEKMTPMVVVEMTQAGINPIDLELDELLAMVTAYDEENQTTEGSKISTLILEMDQSDQLSKEERQSLMAIYRTMDTVTRSKGAATGFMVKNDLSLTLNNLFEAAKYIRKTGQIASAIQVNVDDDFGPLTSVSNKETMLREQVRSGIDQGSQSTSDSGLDRLKTELMDLRVKAFVQSLGQEAMTNLSKGDQTETYKNMPLEEVTALMDDQSTGKATRSLDGEKYLTFIKNNPEFLKGMVTNKIPLTFENFSKAINMNQDAFTMMHDLEAMLEDIQSPDLKNAVVERLTSSAMGILESGDAYEKLEEAMDDVEQMIRDAAEPEDATVYKNAASAKASVNHTQMIQVTEDYYQIPVFINQQVSQLNLYVLNQEAKIGEEGESKIMMSFEAGDLGKVQALMTLNGNDVTLQVQSTYPEDRALLQGYESAFEAIIAESNYSLTSIGYEGFTEKEPIEITQETMTQRKGHRLVDGHIEWSV